MIKNLSVRNSIWIKFSPFILLYTTIVFIASSDQLVGDESRYLMFAQNLIHGFYSPPAPDIDLWNGPGYPLILAPFVLLDPPIIYLRLLNVAFLYSSVIILYKTLSIYISHKRSMVTAIIMGLYWMPYKTLPFILAETFTIFLISCIMYCVCLYWQDQIYYRSIVIGLLIGYLILTKVIFGYVILIFLLLYTILNIFNRRYYTKHIYIILLSSLLLNLPYLWYTYILTNKIVYWSNSGGMSLYWMSTPFEDELGDWQNTTFTTSISVEGVEQKFRENHKKDYDIILSYKGVERDDAFKDKALENISAYPLRYFKNWLANIGRMVFSYPSSYYNQRITTYYNIVPNMFIVVFIVISLTLTIGNPKKIPNPIKFLLFFFAIYLILSSLVSAYERMFYILIPIILLWIAVCVDKYIHLRRYD